MSIVKHPGKNFGDDAGWDPVLSPMPSRRRFIGISAAAAGLALLPLGARAGDVAELVTWRGEALGANCTLHIHDGDRAKAERLVGRVTAELRRLERMFSLYDETSVLVRLNRSGAIDDAPPEFTELMQAAQRFCRVTNGTFDVTVQPLWELYRDHFQQTGADPAGPAPELVRLALDRIGSHGLVVGANSVVLRRGMSVTLNGIAQGFVTDKIVDLLRAEGVSQSLVDMGETRVLGNHPAGRPWEAAIESPDHPERPLAILPLVDRALATSGPYGFQFDSIGRFNHLFAPATGRCAQHWKSVSVVAPTATTADALSTAFCLMDEAGIRAVAQSLGLDLVLLIDSLGQETRLTT